jgi:surfactin synthase thioesterase subunit
VPEAARLARTVLAPWLSGPAVLLGHSFGGYVAYAEVTTPLRSDLCLDLHGYRPERFRV